MALTCNYYDVNLDSEESQALSVHVTKEKLIEYLAKVFYYFPKVSISNDIDYTDNDTSYDEIHFYYMDLCITTQARKYLPDW